MILCTPFSQLTMYPRLGVNYLGFSLQVSSSGIAAVHTVPQTNVKYSKVELTMQMSLLTVSAWWYPHHLWLESTLSFLTAVWKLFLTFPVGALHVPHEPVGFRVIKVFYFPFTNNVVPEPRILALTYGSLFYWANFKASLLPYSHQEIRATTIPKGFWEGLNELVTQVKCSGQSGHVRSVQYAVIICV